MGYGTTIMMILFGISVSFYLYANIISDPVTQMYSNASAGKLSNVSAQSEQLNDQLQSMGMAARSNYTSDLFMNGIKGAFTGLLIGSIASILTGGGFATIYIIPAVALGGILALITPAIDMINGMTLDLPPEFSFIFFTFMGLLLFVFAIAFIRGDM